MLQIETELLNKFQDLIYGQCSLHFSSSRLINLQNRLRERMTACGLSSYEEYFQLIQNDLDEFDTLIEGITTKETYFFRLPAQFKALREMILPQLEEHLSRTAQKLMVEEGGPGPWKIPIRVWSAGSATGEEAYSIAMTLLEGLRYPRAWRIEILASDISQTAITKASTGFYEKKVLNKIPKSYHEKHLQMMDNMVLMNRRLVDLISFRIFNLNDIPQRGKKFCTFTSINGKRETLDMTERFDIIFCRNVLIYFDLAAQQRLMDDLYLCLKPGGYMFTGDAEMIHIYKHKFSIVEYDGAIFYRKAQA